MSADEGRAVLQLLTIHAALQAQGWGAVLSAWHATVVGLAVGAPVGAPTPEFGPPDPPSGASEAAASLRWRRLCAERGVAPDDPAGVLVVLAGLGLLRKRRGLLGRRWAIAEPVPPAEEHPRLDAETRAAAVEARRRFEAGDDELAAG